MQIEVRQSGGVTGLSLHGVLDSDTLPVDQARALKRLVAEVSDKESAETPAGQTRDAIRYSVRIEEAGKLSTLTFDDASMTPDLARLLAIVQPRLKVVPP